MKLKRASLTDSKNRTLYVLLEPGKCPAFLHFDVEHFRSGGKLQ